MSDRVFVTGAGIISAMGVGVEANYQSLLKGESCIGPIRHLQTEHTEFPVGEVALSNEQMSQILEVGQPYADLRTVMMGVIAAKEAIASARLSEEQLSKAAFINGTTVGGMDKTEKHFNSVLEADGNTEEVQELQYNDCGSSTDSMCDLLGKFAIVTTTSTACSSAANAIIFGANLIKAGLADIALVGGTEGLTKFHLNGFNTLMILDTDRCRPFDAERKGINLGEGAAYLVLESEKSAKARGVKILAELKGYANTCDAFHQTATSENGEGAFLAMKSALEMAGLKANEIDYVNAHGTGTPNNDICELAAMERIWGNQLPRFSSTKAFTGHTTSASGSIEAVVSLLAINRGLIPKNIGWENPIKEGAVPVIENETGQEIVNVVDNSFGFGGNDSSLIFSKYAESHE